MSLVPSGVSNGMLEENLINTGMIREQTKVSDAATKEGGHLYGECGVSVGCKLG